jgi:hypothetical protein
MWGSGVLILKSGSLASAASKDFRAATANHPDGIQIQGNFTFGASGASVYTFSTPISTTTDVVLTFNTVTTGFNTQDADVMTLGGNLTIGGTGGVRIGNAINESVAGRSITINSGTVTFGNTTTPANLLNGYTGNTTINGGSLILAANNNNPIANSPVITVNGTLNVSSVTGAGGFKLAATQTLAGSGGVTGAVTAQSGSTISPGASPGSLVITGALTAEAGSTTAIELDGTSFTFNGTEQYDRLKVTGLTTLAGALSVDTSALTLVDGQVFGIVDAVGGRSGMFSNYGEDAVIATSGLLKLKITYMGSVSDGSVSRFGGSDVVLFTAIPEPGALALLALPWLMLKRRSRRI